MEQKMIKMRSIKINPIIGIGYWKDVYKKDKVGIEGVAHNFIIPFIRIQLSYFIVEINNSNSLPSANRMKRVHKPPPPLRTIIEK